MVHSPVVREHAGIPDDQGIMICVALDWPDDSFPANALVSTASRSTTPSSSSASRVSVPVLVALSFVIGPGTPDWK